MAVPHPSDRRKLGRFERIDARFWRTAPCAEVELPPAPRRWSPLAGRPGRFLFVDRPTIAEICLVPQLGNARRFGVDLTPYPRLLAAEATALEIPAFAQAVPDRQPDAE